MSRSRKKHRYWGLARLRPDVSIARRVSGLRQ